MWIGTTITKKIQGKYYVGKVVSVDSEKRYYRIHYSDGDEEKMEEYELLQHFDNIVEVLPKLVHKAMTYKEFEPEERTTHPVMDYLTTLTNNKNIYSLYSGKIKFGLVEYKDVMSKIGYISPWNNNTRFPSISGYSKGNRLEPTMLDLFILHSYLHTFKYSLLSLLTQPRDAAQAWEAYLYLFGRPHDKSWFSFDDLGSGHNSDLDSRAKRIANHCIRNKMKELHFIDGHGRLIVRIMKRLHDANYHNKISVKVYNINVEAHLWHLFTLPYGVASQENILDVLENTKISSKQLFYLNFSGLCGQGPRVNHILKKYRHCQNIYVSFSNSQAGHRPAMSLIRELIRQNIHKYYVPITKRSITKKRGGDGRKKWGGFITLGPRLAQKRRSSDIDTTVAVRYSKRLVTRNPSVR